MNDKSISANSSFLSDSNSGLEKEIFNNDI